MNVLHTKRQFQIVVRFHSTDLFCATVLPQNSQLFFLFPSIETCITHDKNALINVRKGSAGIGLNANDIGMITVTASFELLVIKMCDQPRRKAWKKAKFTQPGPGLFHYIGPLGHCPVLANKMDEKSLVLTQEWRL